MVLNELIDLCISKKHIVSLVGAGGKTTLMYRLAEEAAGAHKKVLVATTTHIFKPGKFYASSIDQAISLWENSHYAVIGRPDEKNPKKLVSPKEELYEALKNKADLILLEADGAKKYPCKLPADHEPVILEDSDLVIAVMGMSALGKELQEICFRYETEGAWLGANSILDEKTAVKILSDRRGSKKSVENKDYIVVLNQCDDHETLDRAKVIADSLYEDHKIKSVCCSLLEK